MGRLRKEIRLIITRVRPEDDANTKKKGRRKEPVFRANKLMEWKNE